MASLTDAAVEVGESTNHLMKVIRAVAWDFQQCDNLTCVDSDKPLQPPFKLRNSKLCSVSSLTIIEYSSD